MADNMFWLLLQKSDLLINLPGINESYLNKRGFKGGTRVRKGSKLAI